MVWSREVKQLPVRVRTTPADVPRIYYAGWRDQRGGCGEDGSPGPGGDCARKWREGVVSRRVWKLMPTDLLSMLSMSVRLTPEYLVRAAGHHRTKNIRVIG